MRYCGLDAGTAAQVVRQRVAVDELHDDPADAVFLARVLRVRDIRVGNRHRVARFEAQARQGQLLARQLGTQDLGGHDVAADAVTGLPDLTHAALSDRGEQGVASAEHAPGA